MAELIAFDIAPWQFWSKNFPNKIALKTDQGSFTWQQLCQEINKYSPVFNDQELPVVFTLSSSNSFEALLCMLGAWQQGLMTLAMNSALASSEINAVLDRVGKHQFIDLTSFLSFTSDKNKSSINNSVNWNEEKPLTLTLTSGSSGFPKVVVHNAKQHLASASGLFQMMPFEQTDSWLLSLPLFHISGLAIIWRWLARGAILKIAQSNAEHLISALNDVSHASLVPAQLQRVIEQRPQHLHSVLLGGSSIPHELVNQAEGLGIQSWCGYGMTEMASTICAKRSDEIDSVGNSLDFRDLCLSDNNEIWVKGNTLALGYYQKNKISALDLHQGWFATKDLGRYLENSQLKITGRLDNMFISGGENIQPEEIERILSHFPNIGQVMVLPIKDNKWGQVPVALIENNIDKDSFMDYCKKKLANFQQPKQVFIIPKQFLNSGIKLSRKSLSLWLQQKQIGEE